MITIREMCTDDIEQCVQIYHRAFEHSDELRKICDVGGYLAGFIGHDDRPAYCILKDNDIIGLITAVKIPGVIYPYTVFIDSFAVDTEYQRKGYGSEALDLFMKLFPCDVCHTLITNKKRPAYKVYEKAGFIDLELCVMENSPMTKSYREIKTKLQAEHDELQAEHDKLEAEYNRLTAQKKELEAQIRRKNEELAAK